MQPAEREVTVWVQRQKDRPNLSLQWIDPKTGQRKSKSAGTANEKEAEKRRAELQYELNHNMHKESSRMAWAEFRKLFEEEYVAAKRKRTRENYQTTMNLFEKLCRPKRLSSITERTLSEFDKGMRTYQVNKSKVGMDASTRKVNLQFLRAALRWAAQQKILAECPTFPTIKVPKRRPQPVPQEAFERLLAKTKNDPQMRVYLLCGWLAGLRLREAFYLVWEENDRKPWIDLSQRRIIFPAKFAKADEDQWVPLDQELQQELLTLPRHGPRVFRFVQKSGEPISLTTVGIRVAKLARSAGVRLTMHSLRKGFGCRYAAKVPAQVLQKLMRHSTIAITMDFYANVDQAVEDAVLGTKSDEKPGKRTTQRTIDQKSPADHDSNVDASTDINNSCG